MVLPVFLVMSELFYSDVMQFSGSKIQDSHLGWNAPDFVKESVNFALEFSKQVQRLVMVDFPRALPTQTLTWP